MTSPLHQRLADDLRRRITSGAWPAGSSAPSEAELCREFDASRGTVRQAIAALRAEGLLVGGQGKPPTVRGGASHAWTELGSFTAWARAQGREPGQHTLLQARHRADAPTADALHLAEGEPVVSLVRLRTLDGVPALLERSTFIWEVGRLLMEFDPDSGSLNRFLLTSGVDLDRAEHRVDAVAAEADDAEHLGVPVGAPLLRASRTTADSSGRILETADDRYVPGECVITVSNRLTAAGGGRSLLRLA
ncbi:GntR family transcriptional regulator [Gordonia phosphorivorans]|uniref:GntR family transcriptional regulator n=1 Tax=Gordonia phosphorivorans TaxID=1056982 RepID=A0ABV6H984_9ACTN